MAERVIVHNTHKAGVTANAIISYVLYAIEVLLAFRFLFRLLGANPGSPFVNFIYDLTAPFIAPFRGIFPTTASEGVVFEWTTVVAMVVYALVAHLIMRLIDMAEHAHHTETTHHVHADRV